jgi:glycosyltransferase involved in cell wall biosynthesis
MLALIGDMHGPSLWRVLWPITALEASGYRCGWDQHRNRLAEALLPAFDGVILPRMSWKAEYRRLADGWISRLKADGKLVVFDADDDVFTRAYIAHERAVYPDDPRTVEQLAAERDDRIWTLGQCDGVTVSTQRLATIVRSFTDRPVIVVPNALDVPWFRSVFRAATRQISGVTIGWAGGRRPDDDLAAMAEAWGRIAERYPAVTFVVAGYQPAVIARCVPSERLVRLPWLPLEQYPAGLAEIDIACCSVADTPFNRAKSPIKAYEAAIAGAAVVATPTVYGALLEHRRTGYLAETVDQWTDALAVLVEQHATRRMIARRLLHHVERSCSLRANLWRWPSAWQTIQDDARARRGRLVAV